MFPFSPSQADSLVLMLVLMEQYIGHRWLCYGGASTMHYLMFKSLESKHVIRYCQGTTEFNGKVNEEIPGLNCVCFVIQLWLCLVWILIVTTVIKFEQQLMFISMENSGMLLGEKSTLLAANNLILKVSFMLLWTDFVFFWNKRYCTILMEWESTSEGEY